MSEGVPKPADYRARPALESLIDSDLCIHVLGHEEETRFVALHAGDPRVPHCRLRVEREFQELTVISDEEVFPERALSPNANRIKCRDSLTLTESDVRWLHAVLGKLIEHMEREP